MKKNSVIKGLTSLRGFVNFGSLSEASRFAGRALSFSGRVIGGVSQGLKFESPFRLMD